MLLPSVLLHDHLDGGVRPATVLELAEQIGYEGLPVTDPEALSAWFDQSDSGSLETYLSAFDHTTAVMQTRDALSRVAYETAIDLADDGVVYFESRFSPPLHTNHGLSQDEVIEAVADGFRRGAAERTIHWALIIDALRDRDDSSAVARLAVSHKQNGVVGFDLAGAEEGNPPTRHLEALRYARESGLRITLHAGEHGGRDGLGHIASSMDRCGAERIGHGVQVIEDCVLEDGEIVSTGPVASRVRARRIPLEMCPASNLATGRMSPENHPIGQLHRAGFNVTISTDNRLMSNTSMSAEFDFVTKYHGFELDDLARVTWRSLDAAFCSWDLKRALWEDQIAPAYLSEGAAVRRDWA